MLHLFRGRLLLDARYGVQRTPHARSVYVSIELQALTLI